MGIFAIDSTSAIMARRHKAVAAYDRLGSFKAAARELKGGTVKFVKRWVERYKGGLSLSDAPRPCRPTVGLEQDEAIELMRHAVFDRLGPPQMVQRLADSLGRKTSAETVRRFLKQLMCRPLRLKKKLGLTPTHKAATLAFEKKWVRKDSGSVLVTETKYFRLCPRSVSPKVWVLYATAPPIDTAERIFFEVHAYAGVSKWGRIKLFVTAGTGGFKAESKGVNGLVYKQLMLEQLCRVKWTWRLDAGSFWHSSRTFRS